MITPVLVVHGGAGRLAPGHEDAAKAGVTAAAAAGRAILQSGGEPLDAVVAAVRVLEDAEVFNAGRGACFNADGIVEVDAGVMRGRDRGVGAVAAVPELADAVALALEVLRDGRHCLLAGPGAVAFARERGVGRFGRDAVWTAKAQARWRQAHAGGGRDGQADTVGAVAIDRHGELAAACSTGGVLFKRPGRVGDSPLPGAGYYAAAGLGAACATGTGEFILRQVACHALLLRVQAGLPVQAAAQAVCDEVAAMDPRASCGLIAIDPSGEVAVACRSEHMSHAIARGDAAIVADVRVRAG